jgi:hypothetical protein
MTTTPTPAPAGPTTIPPCDCDSPYNCTRCLRDQLDRLRKAWRQQVGGGVDSWELLITSERVACERASRAEAELARERRRCEMLLKALREIALHDTVDAPCEHLTSEGCRAWIEETAEEALKDAAKALQGQGEKS